MRYQDKLDFLEKLIREYKIISWWNKAQNYNNNLKNNNQLKGTDLFISQKSLGSLPVSDKTKNIPQYPVCALFHFSRIYFIHTVMNIAGKQHSVIAAV